MMPKDTRTAKDWSGLERKPKADEDEVMTVGTQFHLQARCKYCVQMQCTHFGQLSNKKMEVIPRCHDSGKEVAIMHSTFDK